MQLPTRLSIALATLVAGLIALSQEVAMSHPLHVICVLVGGFVLFLVHPAEGGVVQAPAGEPALPPGLAELAQANLAKVGAFPDGVDGPHVSFSSAAEVDVAAAARAAGRP